MEQSRDVWNLQFERVHPLCNSSDDSRLVINWLLIHCSVTALMPSWYSKVTAELQRPICVQSWWSDEVTYCTFTSKLIGFWPEWTCSKYKPLFGYHVRCKIILLLFITQHKLPALSKCQHLCSQLVMVALWNRADHYIFALWFLLWPPYVIGQAIYIFILSFVLSFFCFSFLA